jgi:hypothetical protein
MARYSRKKINRLITESDNAPNSDVKGDKLEELVKYLFDKIPGVLFYKKNVLDGVRAHELDVVFKNDIRVSELHFLDFVIITECKNTANRLGSSEVRWFIDKLRDRGRKSGILISLSGISGAANGQMNAHSEVINALLRDNITILLLDRGEIESLNSTEELVELLLNKILALTIERTIA